MYIIDESYFKRELSIPNVNETYSESKTNLDYFIDERVRLLLQNALGYKLFKDFDSNVVNGVLDELTAPQKWIDFVNGVEYTKSGKLYKWNGLIYQDGTYKKSVLAKYVYCDWLRSQTTTLTGVGEMTLSATNAMNANSNFRLVNVWNRFLSEYQGGKNIGNGCPTIGRKDNAIYMDWLGGNAQSGYVNMLQFLRDNSEDYPNISGKTYQIMNYIGL